MADNFYALVRQRLAEHAEKTFTRLVTIPHSTHKKALTNTQRHNKWLLGFIQKYGMSYMEYKRKVQAGEIKPMTKVNKRFVKDTESATNQEPLAAPEQIDASAPGM